MQDEVEKLNQEIKAKSALVKEMLQLMQTTWDEVHSRLERAQDNQAYQALGRYYAARDTFFKVDQELAALIGKLKS